MQDCIFCKIIKGEIPANKVYEDDKVIAFLDIAPVSNGHTLVVPKKHSVNIFDIEQEDLDAMSKAIKILAPAIKQSVNADALTITSNNGEASGQAVPHTHTHIIPRFEDDGLKHWPQGKYPEGKAEEIQEKIAGNIS